MLLEQTTPKDNLQSRFLADGGGGPGGVDGRGKRDRDIVSCKELFFGSFHSSESVRHKTAG